MKYGLAFAVLLVVACSAGTPSLPPGWPSLQTASTPPWTSWDEYKRVDLVGLVRDIEGLYEKFPGIHFTLPRKFLVRARGLTLTRALPTELNDYLSRWELHWTPKQELPAGYPRVALLGMQDMKNKTVVWMAIQESLIEPFEQAMPGQLLDLYVMWLGIVPTGESVLAINAFTELGIY